MNHHHDDENGIYAQWALEPPQQAVGVVLGEAVKDGVGNAGAVCLLFIKGW